MSDPRTLVKKALTFSSPERVPRDLWILPWAKMNYPVQFANLRDRFPNDIVGSPGFRHASPRTKGDPHVSGTYTDEWGCEFENVQAGVIGQVKNPLVASWDDLEKVRLPEEFLSIDPERINAFCRSTDRFVLGGCCPRPFERMQFLRGSENLYIDLAERQKDMFTLLDRVHGFYLKELELWAKTGVDALMFMDDWGGQNRLLISPRQWREVFKPLYREYIDLAHQHGKFIFMHSDGYTLDILPDLIELGLDAINTQIFCMDIEELGRRFRGQLTFWGEIDRQELLTFGSPAEIDSAVRRVNEALSCNGGVIAQCEFGAGARPENISQVFQTWDEIGSR